MNRDRRFGPGTRNARPLAATSGGALPRTSLPVFQGRPRHLEAHLDRLVAGASAMGQPADWLRELQSEMEAWLEYATPGEDAALRMVLDPGTGLLSARLEPLPATPDPCRLALLPHPQEGRRGDPLLRHKGLSGPWGAGALATARGLGAEDALLLWPDGTLAETAIAAVGVETSGVLTVPPPQGRVASVAERLDLPAWAEARNLRIDRADVPLALAREGRLWCMNALRGIWPATLL